MLLVALKYYNLIYINIYNIICTARLSDWQTSQMGETKSNVDRGEANIRQETGEMINIYLPTGPQCA